MGGGTRARPCIWFSGFWSQGDGACFEGYWSHAKGVNARIRDYAPTDATLHCIADRLQAIQRRNFYQLAAEVSRRGGTTTRAEYDHLTSDEAIEEGITANAYTFTEAGQRFGKGGLGKTLLASAGNVAYISFLIGERFCQQNSPSTR